MESSAHRKSGFTLIELLVVISIIALLIALLLPAIKRAKASAQSAICGSQLRQLGIAVHGYLSDNSSYFPCTWCSGRNQETGGLMQNWSRLIFEYANYSRETYVCPSAVPENEPFHANSIPDLRIQWRTRAQTIFMGANYTYNTQLNADRHSSFPGLLDGQALTIDHVANTANCPMIEDGLTYPGRQAFEPRAFPDVGPYADESFTWWLNAPAPRHPVENANMVFVDTHVESVPAGVDDLPLPSESYLIWTRWNDIDYQPRGIEFSIP